LQPHLSDRFLRVLQLGRFIHGPEHEQFEIEFAGFLGVEHCLGVASGTDALEIALASVVEPGGTVLTAANCGGYASVAARRSKLRLRYADVDPDTLLVTAATIEEALSDDVRAVVVTHLYGLFADIEPIVDLCRERAVAVIEDCAQAAGARRNGRRAGSFADLATFSFYPTKNLAALGDGGAIVTSDGELAERVRCLRQYGWRRRYEIGSDGGCNSRLDELQAAILRVRLPEVDAENERRRRIVKRYHEALPDAAGHLVVGHGEEYVAHLAVLVARDRPAVREALTAAGVATDVHYPIADHRQPAWRAEFSAVRLPVSEHAVEHVLTLPCFPELRDDEVDRVCEALRGL
jgi:dTDP-4-amino-4,6-dideoxygalactose transaminase